MKLRLLRSFLLTCISITGGHAYSQEWPKAPVKVVVPFDAGSTPDLAARVIGDRLATRLHQPFVVENRSGAAGNIGTDLIAKAEGDGRTIGVSIAGPLGVNALLFRKMPYDAAKDIGLVSIAVSQPSVLVVGSKLPTADAKQLSALMKNKSKLNYASIGAGSISHLAMAALVAQAGGDAVHVPYRGSGGAVTALLSGEVDMALLPAAAVMPHVKAGKLRALAVASPNRSPSLPDLPTLAESGLPDIKGDAWIGFIVPAKTPATVVNALRDQVAQVLAEPAVKDKLRTQYMDPVGNSPEEFRKLLAADVARWKPVVDKNKITLD
ncbi:MULTISPECIES: Bug family tripartite tricarboxylate transporter substrate binding protein [Comamonas]|uniref:Bug family tripartite tricarboxylate transporter substrate binding protein n=1 Tax=Comamonas TaxID=283 RepID=UPI0006B8F590|nr:MULTISPECIES: tripartite tricarboxylate transporter substrate binding protein [Comamonas]QOQ84195.1 tripartite tricarboxylate transporter substrate binding protein [Comamonas thiooxydans]